MRRTFDRKLSILGAILALTGGVDPNTGEKKEAPKERFVAGDHFYTGLNHKRVKGKWRVKR